MPLRLEVRVPDDVPVVIAAAISGKLGSVEFVGSTGGVIARTIIVDPLKTPTTLTLEVSTILRSAHMLLIKLVMALLLLKKSLISMEKCVVN